MSGGHSCGQLRAWAMSSTLTSNSTPSITKERISGQSYSNVKFGRTVGQSTDAQCRAPVWAMSSSAAFWIAEQPTWHLQVPGIRPQCRSESRDWVHDASSRRSWKCYGRGSVEKMILGCLPFWKLVGKFWQTLDVPHWKVCGVKATCNGMGWISPRRWRRLFGEGFMDQKLKKE